MVKKKLLKWAVAPLIAIAAVTAFSSFTGESETGGVNCDMCVVKADGKILYSCKPVANGICSFNKEVYTQEKGWIKVAVNCANHNAC